MISFNYEVDFVLKNRTQIADWVEMTIKGENCRVEDINFIFCSDDYLLKINIKYLKHSTLTDIISFDYTLGKLISGDIFISIDRVRENGLNFKTSFKDELERVMIHGILHFCGYNDKTKEEKEVMRKKEDYYLSLRDF